MKLEQPLKKRATKLNHAKTKNIIIGVLLGVIALAFGFIFMQYSVAIEEKARADGAMPEAEYHRAMAIRQAQRADSASLVAQQREMMAIVQRDSAEFARRVAGQLKAEKAKKEKAKN